MSELMQLFGEGNLVRFRQRDWTLAPFKNKLRAKFQAWLQHRALLKVEATKPFCPPLAYKERLEAMMDRVGGASFEAGNDAFVTACKSFDGVVYQAFLRIHENHPDFTEQMAEELAEELWDELLVRLKEQDTDPNAKAGTPPGSPSPSAP